MKLKFLTLGDSKDDALSQEVLDEFNILFPSIGGSADFDLTKEVEKLSQAYQNRITPSNYKEVLAPFGENNLSFEAIDLEQEKELILNILFFFIYSLKFYLDLTNDRSQTKFQKLNRTDTPPKEAYKYLGHNKMDITEGKKSYALLAE